MKKIFIDINNTRQITLVIVLSLSNIFHYRRPYSRFTEPTLINIVFNKYIAILHDLKIKVQYLYAPLYLYILSNTKPKREKESSCSYDKLKPNLHNSELKLFIKKKYQKISLTFIRKVVIFQGT